MDLELIKLTVNALIVAIGLLFIYITVLAALLYIKIKAVKIEKE